MIGSDVSMRKIIDQLSKKELHGNRIVATTATTINLRRFEDAARKDNPSPQNGNVTFLAMCFRSLHFVEPNTKSSDSYLIGPEVTR